MKVLLISTHARKGGAGVAAYRLMEALQSNSVPVSMLVQSGQEEEGRVVSTTHTRWKHWANILRFIQERLKYLPRERSARYRFLFTPANAGESIAGHPEVLNADIIHLHWVHGAFLSLKTLEEILALGKPVVWTLHDMWAMTGGCHYALECTNYTGHCGNCAYMKKPRPNDLSHRIWRAKQRILMEAPLTLVCPSHWLKEQVQRSALLKHHPVHAIANPIDERVFSPMPGPDACALLGLEEKKRYILFSAATVDNMLKGFKWFKEAIQLLMAGMEDTSGIEILLLGKAREDMRVHFPCPVHQVAYTGSLEKIVAMYSVAKLFVIPSLADNLPNTILEALLCATPVVGFGSGGICEMIDHQQGGYLAERKSAQDLAKGMQWVLDHPDYHSLSEHARAGALEKYNSRRAVEAYTELYQSLMKQK